MRQIDAGLWQLIECAELLDKGLVPIAGGLLDQSGWFVAAAGIVAGEKAYWKSKNFQF